MFPHVMQSVALGQSSSHVPSVHPAGHLMPHAPQFAGSESVSTQAPAHTSMGSAQLAAHVPLEHTWPLAHACAHVPQLSRSLRVSTHDAPHI
jgi:hypothetical protein